MVKRTTMPKRIEKAIFQQFGSQCPFCGEADVSALEIHHIERYAEEKKHELENLIIACANCHRRIEAGEITKSVVYRKKIDATSGKVRPSGNMIHLENSTNTGVIANKIVSRSVRVTQAPPAGTIASDRDARNYVKHLIDRYHQFKEADVGKDRMNYAVFYAAIKRQFGARWDHIALDKFDRVVSYICDRIEKTVLGRNRKDQGQQNYSSFDEFIQR